MYSFKSKDNNNIHTAPSTVPRDPDDTFPPLCTFVTKSRGRNRIESPASMSLPLEPLGVKSTSAEWYSANLRRSPSSGMPSTEAEERPAGMGFALSVSLVMMMGSVNLTAGWRGRAGNNDKDSQLRDGVADDGVLPKQRVPMKVDLRVAMALKNALLPPEQTLRGGVE